MIFCMDKEDLIVSNLDEELPVLGGATFPELIQIMGLLALFNLIIGMFLGLFLMEWFLLIVLIFLIFGTAIGIWLSAKWLRTFKRGKPPGYFLQKVSIFQTKYLGRKSRFIKKPGYWHGNRL